MNKKQLKKVNKNLRKVKFTLSIICGAVFLVAGNTAIQEDLAKLYHVTGVVIMTITIVKLLQRKGVI
jgi:hypothetical protein